jgi:microcystin-dependent protein
MAEPFLGEIRIMSFSFAPKGWALCNGQVLPINQNQALFSLFGTLYGGNGQTTFALPNLQGRAPIHFGSGFVQGQSAGESSHTLTIAEMPAHPHVAQGTTTGADQPAPTSNFLGAANNMYASPNAGSLTTLDPSSISTLGGNQPHENTQPYLTLSFCVALQGIFPSQN